MVIEGIKMKYRDFFASTAKSRKREYSAVGAMILLFSVALYFSQYKWISLSVIVMSLLFPLYLLGILNYRLEHLKENNLPLLTLELAILAADVSLLMILAFSTYYKYKCGMANSQQALELFYDSAQYFFNTGAVSSGVEKRFMIAHVIESTIGYSFVPTYMSIVIYKITSGYLGAAQHND
jgi:Ca2+/Na+ antiporter